MESQAVLSIHLHLFFKRMEKSMECSVCMSDDVIGGGNENFDRIMTAMRKELDLWSLGRWQFSVQGSPDFADAKWRKSV